MAPNRRRKVKNKLFGLVAIREGLALKRPCDKATLLSTRHTFGRPEPDCSLLLDSIPALEDVAIRISSLIIHFTLWEEQMW